MVDEEKGWRKQSKGGKFKSCLVRVQARGQPQCVGELMSSATLWTLGCEAVNHSSYRVRIIVTANKSPRDDYYECLRISDL